MDISVTRFGKFSALWRNKKSLAKEFEHLLVFGEFSTYFGKFVMPFGKLLVLKWPKLNKQSWPSGHTD